MFTITVVPFEMVQRRIVRTTIDNDEYDSLQPTVKKFAYTQRVTRIEWPATIYNNNSNNTNDSPGEHLMQYAAEKSCRTRYGLYSEWMTFLDTDEYFVPIPT